MRRLIALTITLICLALPTGIAYGSCNSTNALDRELDREALATYGASVANPSECRQTADSALVSTASTRTYDPSTGRFTAADPLETRNELDLEDPYVSAYVYVNNRATSMVDPSGELLNAPGEGGAAVGEAESVGTKVVRGVLPRAIPRLMGYAGVALLVCDGANVLANDACNKAVQQMMRYFWDNIGPIEFPTAPGTTATGTGSDSSEESPRIQVPEPGPGRPPTGTADDDDQSCIRRGLWGPFHRRESPTQTAETAAKQVASQEIWGREPRGSNTPTVQAYVGELAERGVEFCSYAPPRANQAPGQANWYAGMPGVWVENGFAKIKALVYKNTQT